MERQSFITERLVIRPTNADDTSFILELLNTDGWLKFIGNKNVSNKEEAQQYIDKIDRNTNIHYWSVCLKHNLDAIGLITFIKRDYLPHNDIGFAFLPGYAGKGYALEAASKLMEFLQERKNIHPILATSLPGNESSINLLQKLGLKFQKNMVVANQEVLLYSS